MFAQESINGPRYPHCCTRDGVRCGGGQPWTRTTAFYFTRAADDTAEAINAAASILLRCCSRTSEIVSSRDFSAVEHRPADVVPQPLVVEYELTNRRRELVALPPALEPPCALTLSFRRGSTCGLDRIGGRTQLVRGDVRDDCCLASSICGTPGCP